MTVAIVLNITPTEDYTDNSSIDDADQSAINVYKVDNVAGDNPVLVGTQSIDDADPIQIEVQGVPGQTNYFYARQVVTAGTNQSVEGAPSPVTNIIPLDAPKAPLITAINQPGVS